MERLQEVCASSQKYRKKEPPLMNVVYSEEGNEEVAAAARAALSQPGADPAAVYRLVIGAARRDGLDRIHPCIDAVLLPSVSADTIVDADKRETVLHELLSRQHPPPLAAQAEHPQVSLQALLDRGATPDLQDASGNTALHLLVVRVAKEKAFPDLDPRLVMQLSDPDQLYRDDERIDFLEGVGTALVRAGWSLDLPNAKGRTPRRLLQLSHHIAEAKREALRRSLEHSIELAADMAGPGARNEADGLRLQNQRQLERVDRMQAVLARLQGLAPQPAAAPA
ncbi:hypothetical protein ABPG77_007108 [Micractinium sp. CCAP 211/92]